MIIIAHRGNICGSNPERENHPDYLREAIAHGFYVEYDLWKLGDTLYLGHDAPTYPVTRDFLCEIGPSSFCHCKNISALEFMLTELDHIECFYHENDRCTLTSHGHIWNYPGSELTNKTICVMPELSDKSCDITCAFGVCTDFPMHWKNEAR